MRVNNPVILMGAEESFVPAIQRYCEVINRKCVVVTEPTKILDENLTIRVVRSTTNKGKDESLRNLLAKASKLKADVICDGKLNGVAIGTHTIEGSKGSNKLRYNDLAVILTYRHPQQITDMMTLANLTEQEAVARIVSDAANQAIGRNTGFRQNNTRCLLIVPEGLVNSLQLHTVTTDFAYANTREAADMNSGYWDGIFKELHDSCDYVTESCALVIGKAIASIGCVAVKNAKACIKDILIDMGIAKRRIKSDRLVGAVMSKLEAYGVTQSRKTKQVNGSRKSTQVLYCANWVETLTDEQQSLVTNCNLVAWQ